MRHFLHHVLLLGLCCSLTLFATTACGEIDLPQPETPGNSGDDGKPSGGSNDNNSGSNDNNGDNNGGNSGTGSAPDNGTGNNSDAGGGDEHDAPSGLVFGTAILTDDGHLLINNSFYLSVVEHFNVTPTTSSHNEAAAIAAKYTEGTLSDWHIPTLEEVKVIRAALACTSPYYQDPDIEGIEMLPLLNAALDKRDLLGIYREKYLCDDGRQVFDLLSNGGIGKADAAKKYRLRLTRKK